MIVRRARFALILAFIAPLPLLSADWTPLTKKAGKAPPVEKGATEAKPSSKGDSKKNHEYETAIASAAAMTYDERTAKLVRKKGLSIMNITWEDTGRYKDSAVGPNISDMSIQVGLKQPDGTYQLTLMPVIRYDNFTDRTADVDPASFTLLVGNEKGKELKRVSLREFLEDPTKYLSQPKSWLNKKKSLLADRDTHVLVSAQASFLPVPKTGVAEFNPVLFNYQSVSGDPAVLAILVTREGTSTTVIDNKRDSLDGGGWGQRLFHNRNGERASLTGQRMSDFAKTSEGKKAAPKNEKGAVDVKKSSGLNMVLLIQVPLKQKTPPPPPVAAPMSKDMEMAAGSLNDSDLSESAQSDVEAAVIGSGKVEGPFTEVDDLNIERDPKFPIRVTVQFYKATATGVADETDIAQIKEEIDSVLSEGDFVGSLVVAGETGRPTEYEGMKVQPADWWEKFWKRHESNTGEKRAEAMKRLSRLMGKDFIQVPVCGLYLTDQLRADKLQASK